MEPGRDPISDIDALEAELAAYVPTLQGDQTLGDLAERPRAVVLNKIDVPDAREMADFIRGEIAERYGWPVFEVSAVSRDGLRPLIFALWDMVAAYRAAQPAVAPRRPVIRPVAIDESGFTVSSDGDGGFVVRGTRPERWISQTDFGNDEAVGYLGDRLARLGVEDELLKLGARPGCAVTIGAVTFDWEPQTPAGVDITMTGRGTDIRIDQSDRIGAAERKIARRSAASPAATTSDQRALRRSGALGAPGGHPHRAQRRGQGGHHRTDHRRACSTPVGWPTSPMPSSRGCRPGPTSSSSPRVPLPLAWNRCG